MRPPLISHAKQTRHTVLIALAAILLAFSLPTVEAETNDVPVKLSEPLLFSFAQMCDTQLGMGGYEHDVKTFGLAVDPINKKIGTAPRREGR